MKMGPVTSRYLKSLSVVYREVCVSFDICDRCCSLCLQASAFDLPQCEIFTQKKKRTQQETEKEEGKKEM